MNCEILRAEYFFQQRLPASCVGLQFHPEERCRRRFACRNSLGSARRYDSSAILAAARPHVDNIVGTLDDIEIMFDDNDRIAAVDKSVQNSHECGNVVEMKACCRLIENEESATGIAFGKFGSFTR